MSRLVSDLIQSRRTEPLFDLVGCEAAPPCLKVAAMQRRAKGKRLRPRLFRLRPTLRVCWLTDCPMGKDRALLLSSWTYSRNPCLAVISSPR